MKFIYNALESCFCFSAFLLDKSCKRGDIPHCLYSVFTIEPHKAAIIIIPFFCLPTSHQVEIAQGIFLKSRIQTPLWSDCNTWLSCLSFLFRLSHPALPSPVNVLPSQMPWVTFKAFFSPWYLTWNPNLPNLSYAKQWQYAKYLSNNFK